ncbi:LysR family transcriptional regulator [Pleomorphomonas koreensis]|uniref:LysR family transcriptional regulator n=1 Tax=Pleomorphomonas koreensis TaxID=257440 RepID=UPI0004121204|nr:LysR family transcriptional regulator [Pleomorphomonas koreensis]
MDWDHFRVFLAVARGGQLSAAARRLGVNHTTVARRLDALEAALGTALFERRPTGCVLTEAGARLIPVAERIEIEARSATAAVVAGATEVSGTVRVGAPDGLGNSFLARELGLFAARHPGVTVELVPLPLKFSVSRREADLVIELARPTAGRLVASKLVDYTLGVYAAASYLDRHGRPTTPEDLNGHLLVTGIDDYTYSTALDYTATLQAFSRRLYRCAGATSQLEAIRSGAGIGVLHDFVAVDAPGLERILPQVGFARTYWLVGHPGATAIAAIAACRRYLVETFRRQRRHFQPYGQPEASSPPEPGEDEISF